MKGEAVIDGIEKSKIVKTKCRDVVKNGVHCGDPLLVHVLLLLFNTFCIK